MLAEFSAFPVGKGESLSEYVAHSIKIIEESGMPFWVNPMGTVVEGEPEQVWALMAEVCASMRREAPRVLMTIKIDDREGPLDRLERKVASVEEKLGHALPG